jgi:VWFA-related protein
MKRFLQYAGAIGLMALGAAPLASQQPGDATAVPVIRVTVDLVQVDAVVTDSQGHHIANLKPEDFEILEDGKPQKITHFSYVPGTAVEGRRMLAKPAPTRRIEEARGPRPPVGPALRQDKVHRTIVMIADDLGLSSDDIPNVRRAMKSFVESQMQPDDLVSIMTSSGGTGALEQPTNDRRQLYACIDRIHWSNARTSLTWYEPVHKIDAASEFENASNGRLNAIRRPFLGAGTLGVLTYAIQGLRDMPGRKAIALFSDGFPQSADGIIQQANRASVVIYTLDPRGLASFFLTAADWCKPPVCKVSVEEAKRQRVYVDSQRSLDELARGTGGIFFHDDNDLIKGLSNALDDLGSYYLIGYQPNRQDFEKMRGQVQFHKIVVKALRAGLLVRSRNGFAGIPDSPAEDIAPKSGKEALRKALSSAFHANGFPVQLSAFYSAATRKDPKTGRRPAVLRAMLAIDARGLKFNDTAEGKKQLDLDIVAAVYGAESEVVESSDRTFRVAMTPDEMNQTLTSGLLYGFEIEIMRPGPYQLRVAAWDANSERMGSAATFVEVPDFNRAGLALSSVQLYDSDPERNEKLTLAGVVGAGSAVTRMFGSGALLRYDSTVYGARTDPQTGKPKISMAVHLFRGPEQIYNGQPIPIVIPDGKSTAAVHASGVIKLPATMPPGDYALELTVYDEWGKKTESRAQWVDFTLLKK